MEKLLKVRFIYKYDDNYPKEALHIFAENEHAVRRNEAVINDLTGELYTVVANDKIIDNCKYLLTLIQTAQNYVQAIRFMESFQMDRIA